MFRDSSNLPLSTSQFSQDEFGLTPSDIDTTIHTLSPVRKRGKPGRISRLLGMDTENNPSLFNLAVSQDSQLSQSQTSCSQQDVMNRLGQLSCRVPYETSMDGYEDHTNESYVVPSLTPKPSLPKTDNKSDGYGEKKITIAPAVINPFIREGYKSSKHKRPTTMWIQPYKERPRYITDFEEEGVLGEGSFSVVYRARKRIDGTEYAVKRLKSRICSESEGIHLLREVCALAALKGCPNLVQFYNAWVEDAHIWMQMELCLKTNLDVFVRTEQRRCTLESSTPHSAMLFMDDDVVSGSNGDCKDDVYTPVDEPARFVPQIELFTEKVFWKILQGICSALAFMHSKGMAHLDIRPANVFLSPSPASSNLRESNVGTTDEPSVSLYSRVKMGVDRANSISSNTSSGMSVSASQGDSQDILRPPALSVPPLSSQRTDVSPPITHVITAEEVRDNVSSGHWEIRLGDLGLCCSFGDHSTFTEGESRYCAGELINGSSKSIDFAKADIFSVGASLLELCTGRPLSAGGDDTQEWHSLRDGVLLRDNGVAGHWGDRDMSMYSESIRDVLKQMLHPEISNRPDATTLRDLATRELRKLVVASCANGLNIAEAEVASDVDLMDKLYAEVQRLKLENHKLRNHCLS
mmetsp:Transcript_9326/g.14057  ORF Transcript_9326/g.14057 Transcript_9326/m.14057 type:complete len:636 (+) Transcript_9326:71-1978(+)